MVGENSFLYEMTPKDTRLMSGSGYKIRLEKIFEVNEYTFRVTHFHICFPAQEGFSFKGMNLPSSEQILSFKSGPHFGKTVLQVSKQEVTKIVSL